MMHSFTDIPRVVEMLKYYYKRAFNMCKGSNKRKYVGNVNEIPDKRQKLIAEKGGVHFFSLAQLDALSCNINYSLPQYTDAFSPSFV